MFATYLGSKTLKQILEIKINPVESWNGYISVLILYSGIYILSMYNTERIKSDNGVRN
jgi:hypothetical protein